MPFQLRTDAVDNPRLRSDGPEPWNRPASRPGEECMEVPLLVPTRQWAALEEAARLHGLTVGQMLRRLIAAYLTGSGPRSGAAQEGDVR